MFPFLDNPAGNKPPPWEVSLLTSHPRFTQEKYFAGCRDEAAFWAKGKKSLQEIMSERQSFVLDIAVG